MTVLRRCMYALVAVLVLLLCGCQQKSEVQTRSAEPLLQYTMSLELDEQGRLVYGEETVIYKNPSGAELSEIPFFVYPNAYQGENTAPFFESEMHDAYPNGFSYGGIEINEITANGKKAEYALENSDETVLILRLATPLKKGGTAEINFNFTVTIPNSLGRFGYGEKAYNLCNFYPIACPYVDGDFLKYEYLKAGDPFVSDISNYSVTLAVPEGMVVAHTGDCPAPSTKDGVTVYQITANNVRDFAAVASRYFIISEETVGGTLVRSYYYRENAKQGKNALDFGADAIKAFNSMFGPYVYDTFSVVQTDFFIGGMEYPGIVLIDQSLYTGTEADEIILEHVVVHETAHQWWYAAVGNDQVKEPWLDEALTDYSTFLYYGRIHSQEHRDFLYSVMVESVFKYYDELYQFSEEEKRVGRRMDSFDDSAIYSLIIYTNGTRMFAALEEVMGLETLTGALGVYYRDNCYTISTKQRLLDAIKKHTGKDYGGFFSKWL